LIAARWFKLIAMETSPETDAAGMAMEGRAIDKSKWGAGPWQDEPDRVDFIAFGFSCFARRHPQHGHWCGYVGVPREHPFYGKPYGDVEGALEFHRGINYSALCDEAGDICHVPAPGMPADVWWFGGDFGHGFDLCPGIDARWREAREAFPLIPELPGMPRDTYRALPYVRQNIEHLAEQLAAIAAADALQHAGARSGCETRRERISPELV
jgi:hypothetical protein